MLLISLGVGMGVFLIGVYTEWRRAGDTLLNSYPIATDTHDVLRFLSHRIAERLNEGGSLPASLTELAPELERGRFRCSKAPMLRNGIPVDGWGRPLLFQVTATTVTLMSYGRDGVPGGTNLDQDEWRAIGVHGGFNQSDNPFPQPDVPPPPPPSLRRYLFELPSRGFILAIAGAGGLAFALTLILLYFTGLGRGSRGVILAGIAATIFATWLIGTVIAQIHTPSGH